MREFWVLTRAAVKANSLFSLLRLMNRGSRREALTLRVAVGAAVAGLLPLYFMAFAFVRLMVQLTQPVGQTAVVPLLIILMAQFLVLVLGFYYTMAMFFFSNDLGWLVPLPVTPGQLIMSKVAAVLANETLSMLPFLPVLVYFGIVTSAGPAFWLFLPAVFFLLPVIPLALASLLVVLLVRFVNVGRRKDLLIVVGSLLLVIAAFSMQAALAGGGEISAQQAMQALTRPDGLLQVAARRFPPAGWASAALAFGFSGRGLAGMAMFIGASALLLLLLWRVGRRMYYKGLIGLSEVTRRGRRLLAAGLRAFRPASPLFALFHREWRLMNRTPMFLLNGVLATILFPLLFAFMFSMPKREADFDFMLALLRTPQIRILAAAAILLFCGGFNGTAASALSREGSRFWISKVLPVPFRTQVLGKLLHALAVSLLGIVAGSLFLVFSLHFGPGTLAAAWLPAMLGALLFAAIGLAIDLARPLLDWVSPQQAIKQNMNVLLSMVIDMALIAGLGFLCFRLDRAGLAFGLIYGLLALLLGLMNAAALAFLFRRAGDRYLRIEK